MWSFEKSFDGILCGIDEVGRGPLAGPVMAACVYIPPEHYRKHFWRGVTDSKKLTPERREALYEPIRAHCCYGIAQASPVEIDSLNIHHATLLAMRRAFEAMAAAFNIMPGRAMIDGKFVPDIPCHGVAVIGGDNACLSIAAASIIAKVERDRLMAGLHEKHPHYGWSTNAGYGTPEHKAAITLHGITEHHRRSFAPVREAIPA